MRISEIRIQNYRTISELSLKFPRYYTAICGKNDAGKSNIIRLLRSAFKKPDRIAIFPEADISVEEDFTKWKEKEVASAARFIHVDFVLQISRQDDEGLHQFLQTYLALPEELISPEILQITISIRQTNDEKSHQIGLSIGGIPYEDLKAQEVYKRLRSSAAMLFHDSTEFFHPYRFRESADLFSRKCPQPIQSGSERGTGEPNKTLTRVAKKNQQDLTEMLGRLKINIG